MSRIPIEFYICLSIFWTFICLAKCGKCPLNGLHKPVDFDACSSCKGNSNGLQNTFTGYFGLDYGPGHQKRVPVAHSEDVCGSSELFHLSQMLYGFNSEAQCSRMGILDVNRKGSGAASTKQCNKGHVNASWSSDRHMFHLPDGGTVTCSLNYRELGHGISPASVNKGDHINLSSCGGHLPHHQGKSSFPKNLEIEKSQSSDVSSPRVNISPNKLDWGHNYLYHPSVVFLRLQNTCNESVLEVYEPFSTNNQFYPFNFSEVALGPGEVAVISFVFSPKWLGLSSAELILQTSLGGFLVEAQGLAVESPHRLRPLEGLDVSSGGGLSRKLSLLNPFDESIHLEEVAAWVTVYGSSAPLLAEIVCSKQDPRDTYEHSFSDSKTVSSVESGKFNFVDIEIRPLSNWVISPEKTESILEMAFSPGSEGQVLGAICMQLVRPLEGEKDTLVVPFEAELMRTATWKDSAGLLSVSLEAVGCCDVSKTTISVSVRNNALLLSKVIGISEVSGRKKLLQIKYSEGLLLFPGTATQVALVNYESPSVKYDSLIEMDDVNMSCMLQILTNDTISPILEIPCRVIFGICSRQQPELSNQQLDIVDFSNKRTGSLTSSGKLPFSIEALGYTKVDEFVLQNWRGQSTMSGLYLLDDHELLFPIVPIGRYFGKTISVKNPSQEPVIVQLILNSEEIIDECKTHNGHLQQPSSSSFIDEIPTRPSSYGFSIINSTVTEAYLHPYGSAILGPILFHPSNRCEWKSLALIRNNLSGVEWLSLHGSGGSLSLTLLEGSEIVHRLAFNVNFLLPLSMSSPDMTSNSESAISSCHKPLLKKLFAVNTGDFPVKVEKVHVSGSECGLDGFIVHNCKGFSLEPGESVEFGISYLSDFSAPLVHRDLELMLATGILVVPMKASLSLHILNFCRKSIFWVRVKKCCISILIATVIISLLFWFLMAQMTSFGSLNCSIKGETSSCDRIGSPKSKSSSSLNCNKGNNGKSIASTKKGCLRSVQRDEAAAIESVVSYSNCQHGDLNHPVEYQTDKPKEIGSSPSPVSLTVRTHKEKRRRARKRKGAGSGVTVLIEASSSQSGNSTPPSPLSPFTTLSVSPEGRCSPSSVKRQPPPDSSSPFGVSGGSSDKDEQAESGLKSNGSCPETIGYAGDSGNHNDHLLCTQQLLPLPGLRKMGSKPMLLPSATFPGVGRSCPPSRLAITPHARAPGPKLPKAVEPEVQASTDDSFTYDIWGNHFSGFPLITRATDPSGMSSEAIGGNSESFFLRGPQQTLLTNFQPRFVSSSYEQG